MDQLTTEKEKYREWLGQYVQKFGVSNKSGNPTIAHEGHNLTWIRKETKPKLLEPKVLSLLEEKGLLEVATITTRKVVEPAFMDLVTGNKISAEEYLRVVEQKEPSYFLDVRKQK